MKTIEIKKMNKLGQGISLIMLIIIIVVIIILVGAVIMTFRQGGLLDDARKGSFMSDFRSIEEGVNVYSISKIDALNPTQYLLPTTGKLSLTNKQEIVKKVPTLNTKIEELNAGKNINDIDLYWIDAKAIGANSIPDNKKDKGYIIDAKTKQIYDYYGEYFYGLRWHTLDSGVPETSSGGGTEEIAEEMWDGWIKLTLYYPSNATEKKWRLGSEGELRADSMLMWQDYTGPITIPLDRVKDVWIKYKLDNKEVTIPPAGKLLVDIISDKTGSTKVDKVNITINYDESATTKEYKINDSGWLTYTGPFVVTENCIIEARAKKVEEIYNTDGSLLMTRDIVGSDMVYVGNIGVEEENVPKDALPAPTIEKLPAQNSNEKARIKITYPEQADKKIYTKNYGMEQNYSNEISITEWGTTIVGYYYDVNGEKSRTVKITVYDPDAAPGEPNGAPKDNPNPGEPEKDDTKVPKASLPAPTITRLTAQNSDEKARVSISYPTSAVRKIYKINYGVEQNYSNEISITQWGTNIIAYYYDENNNMSQIASITINEATSPPKTVDPLPPYTPKTPLPPISADTDKSLPAPTLTKLTAQSSDEKARVQASYPSQANRKVYTINNGAEIEYVSDIKILGWGTKITAYYYDSNGVKSKQATIIINEDTTQTKETPVYEPESVVKAPTINLNPSTGTVSEVTVSVDTPVDARKVYLKLGKYGEYKEYTGAVVVRENMEVYAYYIAATGETSLTAHKKITNIKQGDKPYLKIDADPYPWPNSTGANNVKVNITTTAADKVEYSEDGIVYKVYTGTIDVTKNERIYARATNSYGVVEDYIDITNIGELIPTEAPQKLNVSINVDPEPSLSMDKVSKAKVSIEYDSRATEKYYTIGKYGELKTYAGEFEVTNNCTIYAYAKNTNGSGTAIKTIDNILTGISNPVITAIPNNGIQSSKVSINISYYKSATIKQYSINGAGLRDYGGEFEITENGTTIYAYSQNSLGEKSESRYKIENIVPELPILLLDKGDYYILKLNYPEGSKGQEYKWKADGIWTTYKEDGILLVKPQFKDKIIKNGTLVKIEDENGNMKTFNGDYYLIDVPISELFENLFMRWDRVPPTAPQIVLDPENVAKQVSVNIIYADNIVKKQYKVVSPEGVDSGWKDYKDPITVDKNNTIIYAKGMDDTEVWSSEAIKKVTNIDEIQPEIKITADLEMAQQKVGILVSATDNMGVGKVKYAKGLLGESYFKTGGTVINNNSVVNITENGYYTFYAEDTVGNAQIYTLNVSNVDLIAPSISISVNPEDTIGTTTNATIDYGDSTVKQYKIGTINNTWTNYTGQFAVSSYTILSNNWQNSDGTVTVYAKGKDSAGNEVTVQKKILNLDLNRPSAPVISSNGSGYPIMMQYGIEINGTVTITYDTRTDIDNLYSIDNGVTWKKYEGQFNIQTGTVIAKSVKKISGLEISSSKTITLPTGAMPFSTYDNNASTGVSRGTCKMEVDRSMWGKSLQILWSISNYGVESSTVVLQFVDNNNSIISSVSKSRTTGPFDERYTIPNNTKWIIYTGTEGQLGSTHFYPYLYEIQVSNQPIFSATNGYILLHADDSKEIDKPYQMISIDYFSTSVQRLYRIGTTGEWLNYNDQPIWVWQGDTIYAKGIDKYGNETRIVSSYTANSTGAMPFSVHDHDNSTGISLGTYTMEVDKSMWGKNLQILWSVSSYGVESASATIQFIDSNNSVISSISKSRTNGTFNERYTIPNNTKWITYSGAKGQHASTYYYPYLYEIQKTN